MSTLDPLGAVFVALHYQNENCHPDGRIKIGIGGDAAWREATLGRAERLMTAIRGAGVPIVHVRLAVRPDYAGVVANTPIFRQWIEQNAWQEGTWGAEFYQGLGPAPGEAVVTHTRNSGFGGGDLAVVLAHLRPRQLVCAGVSTAYAVESTVRDATDLGYEAWVVADACSTATREQHEAALGAMSLLASITTTDELLAGLER